MTDEMQRAATGLVQCLEKAGITRIVVDFTFTAEAETRVDGYQLYQPWDHGLGGNLYIDSTHEFDPLPKSPHQRVMKCAACGEGPLDGDHYGTPGSPDDNPEEEIVQRSAHLLNARFKGALAAHGHLKVDTETKRVWTELGYEHREQEPPQEVTFEL